MNVDIVFYVLLVHVYLVYLSLDISLESAFATQPAQAGSDLNRTLIRR